MATENYLQKSLTEDQEIQLPSKQSFAQRALNFIFNKTPKSARKITNNFVYPQNYHKNQLNTKKFTLYNFIPKFLLEELKITINIVYIFFVVFNYIFHLDSDSLINFYSLHLIISLSLSFLKELYFFLRSALNDYKWNSYRLTKITKKGERWVKRGFLKVGDIIEITGGQQAPADLLILRNNSKDPLIWAKTDQLDGNLNSQLKEAISCINELSCFEDFFKKQYEFLIEKPNPQTHSFNGYLNFDNQNQKLTINNCLWKNCSLTTGSVYALVIYTGPETKANYNLHSQTRKITPTDSHLTSIYITQLCCFIIVSLVGVFIFKKPVNNLFKNLNANFVYYGIFISIAPRILLDWTRLALAYRLNTLEARMRCKVNNIEIVESPGTLDTLLIDKTGTLTRNSFSLSALYSLGFERQLSVNSLAFEKEVQNLFKKIKSGKQLSVEDQNQLMLFLGALICTEIYTQSNYNDQLVYNGVSQEEIAIVNFFRKYGVVLKKKCKKYIEIEAPYKITYKFEIIQMFLLQELQCQMGVVVKCLDTNQKYVFFKGSEAAILPKVNNKEEKQWLSSQLAQLRLDGLRTLNLVYKKIQDLEESIDLNNNFDIIGIFGVQDRFQDQVQQTLLNLRRANIKTWIVTGDEIDTIKSITTSLKFKEKHKQFYIIDETESYYLQLKLEHYNHKVHLMIIIGQSFEQLVQIEYLKKSFLEKVRDSNDLCFCQFSAQQKETLVRVLQKQNQIVGAVGDGSNDIQMIQKANVGIGVSNDAKTEASVKADFVISQFSDLQSLIIHKGRLFNMIVSKNIIWAYWSLVYAGLMLWFFNLYSGIGFYKLLTNLCFFCCAYFYIFGDIYLVLFYQDLSITDILDYPNIYIYSQKQSYLNLRVILQWLFQIFSQNFIIQTLLFYLQFSIDERRFVLFCVMMIEGYFALVPALFQRVSAYRYFIFDICFLVIVSFSLQNRFYLGRASLRLIIVSFILNVISNLPFWFLRGWFYFISPSNEQKIIIECQKKSKIRTKTQKIEIQDFQFNLIQLNRSQQ